MQAVIAIATAIVGVAIVAVIVGRNSASADVLSSLGNAYTSALREAVSPIAGQT